MKLASEIINTDVLAETEGIVFGKAKSLIIDPESGGLVALQVYGKGIKKKRSLISSLDIKHIDYEIIIVGSLEDVGDAKELPAPYKILNEKIQILGSKVLNEDGLYLGKVVDFALDSNINQLSRIYVAKKGLGFLFNRTLIFSYIQIVEIKRGIIIVSTDPTEALMETSPDILT